MKRKSEISNPLDLTYMKIVRLQLNCLGVWPYKDLGDNGTTSRLLAMLNNVLTVYLICSLCAEALYIKEHFYVLNFIRMGHSYINLLVGCLIALRLTIFKSKTYREVIKEFALKFHLMHHKDRSYFAAEMHTRVDKMCLVLCVIVILEMYMGYPLYNITPIYNNYKAGMFSKNRPVNGTFQHSVDYYLPIDLYTNSSYYTLFCLLNWFLSYFVSVGLCFFDLMISIMVFHIWGHLNILSHSLQYFLLPSQEISSDTYTLTKEGNKAVFEQLKNLVLYHKMIKGFLSRMSAAYSIQLFMFYTFHQVTGCVLLMECSSLDPEALGTYAVLTLVLFQQLIQVSVIFELINSQADRLVDDVYGLPWETMDVPNRKIVLQFLQNVQEPLSLKAGDMVPVGVMTMSAILRGSFSYFLMLKTFQKV